MADDPQTTAQEEQFAALNAAIGESLMAWALAELMLNRLFQQVTASDVSDAIWGSVKSFDGKMAMLHNVLSARMGRIPALQADWTLLHEHTRRLAKRRNEIAHATLIYIENEKRPMLEPFYIPSVPKKRLATADVLERRDHFRELAQSLNWFSSYAALYQMQPVASAPPAPDLVLRLRTEELRRREEQRKQRQSSRE